MKYYVFLSLFVICNWVKAQVMFMEYDSSILSPIYGGTTEFINLGDENFIDLIILGVNENGSVCETYQNINGIFTPNSQNSIDCEEYNLAMEAVDVDSDGDLDLLISSFDLLDSTYNRTRLYRNEGGSLQPDAEFDFPYSSAPITTADINSDGSMDIILVEFPGGEITRKFINNGNGYFTEVPEGIIEKWYNVDFADIDNDGDQDLAAIGASSENSFRMYENDGNGNFSLVEMDFGSFYLGDVVLFDYDNDGDNDLILNGVINDNFGGWDHKTQFYENEGDWQFFEITDDVFMDLSQGSINALDVDADNDLDILLTGARNTPEDITFIFASKLYINENGAFSELPDQPFQGVAGGSVSIADVNNDETLDILISGNPQTDPIVGQTKLYINNGTGLTFTERNIYKDIILYPNPAEKRIHFTTYEGELINYYRVISMDGKTLIEEKLKSPISLIDKTIAIPNGQYLLEITTLSNSTYSQKFVVRN